MEDCREMIFDSLDHIQIPVKYQGKRYILVEADEEAAIKVKNLTIRHTRVDEQGRPTSMGDIADAEPLLVSLCLFHADDDGKLRLDANGFPDVRYRVPLQLIKRWPSKVVGPLYQRVQQVSALAPQTEDEAALRKQLVEVQEKLDRIMEKKHPSESSKSNNGVDSPDSDTTDGARDREGEVTSDPFRQRQDTTTST